MRSSKFSLLVFLILALVTLAIGCTKSSNTGTPAPAVAAGAIVELPDPVTGKFTGTLMYGGQTSQFPHATITKNGLLNTISFSGRLPPVPSGIPQIEKLQFTPGKQNGVFDSVSADASVTGVHVSAYKTNLNIDVVIGGIKVIFVGVKCDVVPESPFCTCEVNPSSPMCL